MYPKVRGSFTCLLKLALTILSSSRYCFESTRIHQARKNAVSMDSGELGLFPEEKNVHRKLPAHIKPVAVIRSTK